MANLQLFLKDAEPKRKGFINEGTKRWKDLTEAQTRCQK